MTESLAGFQSGFVKALFEPDGDSALTHQPAFAVYRNTVMSGCIDATPTDASGRPQYQWSLHTIGCFWAWARHPCR